MIKKYILTNETKIVDGHILHRIQAVRSFDYAEKGDLGGFVESEKNLSHKGNCWINDDACVFGNARVYDNACVFENARVYEDAEIFGNARVYEDAEIYGHAEVYGHARVYGFAQVFDFSEVYGVTFVYEHSKVYGNAEVYDRSEVYGKSEVCENAKVYKKLHIQYGILKIDLLKEKNIELIVRHYDENIKINDNKIILYLNVDVTRNKNMSILKSSNGDLIFERNKNIMTGGDYLKDYTSQIKNKSKSDYFAKIQINLEDIKCINLYYLICSKFKILNIVKGGV